MKYYVIHDVAGKILQYGNCPDGDVENHPLKPGEAILEHDGKTPIQFGPKGVATHKVDLGTTPPTLIAC